MKLLQIPCELQDFRTYATKRSVKISFETQEDIKPSNLAQLLSAKNQTGWLVFSPNADKKLDIKDIPKEPVKEFEHKTKSQRLRATIFIWWDTSGRVGDFDDFYKKKMETLIDFVKEKLPKE